MPSSFPVSPIDLFDHSILATAAGMQCKFAQQDRDVLQAWLQFSEDAFESIFDDSENIVDAKSLQRQATHLAKAYGHVLLAAADQIDGETNRASEHTVQSILQFQQAWTLVDPNEWVAPGQLYSPYVEADIPEELRPLFGRVADLLAKQATSIDPSSWATVQRILILLMQHSTDSGTQSAEFGEPCFKTKILVPFARDGATGLATELIIGAYREGVSCFYLEPSMLEFTLLDDVMLRSLQLAWQNARRGIQANPESPPFTIRLTPDLPPGTRLLRGASAGALCACGIYAGAAQQELDEDATVTAALDPNNPEQLRSVSGLEQKFAAIAEKGVRRIVLCGNQDDGQSKTQAESAQPLAKKYGLRIHAAKNIAQAYRFLTGNAAMHAVLQAYCDAQVQDWNDRRYGRKDDLYHLDCYVPAHYSVQHGEQGEFVTLRDKSMLNPAKRGDDDVLEAWDAADVEARDSILAEHEHAELSRLFKSGRRICLTQDAGAGKSVCALRTVVYFSSQEGQREFYDAKPVLAVRWDERHLPWPTDFGEVAIVQAMAAELEPFAGNGAKAEEVVRWALQNWRVVVVLDSLDQVNDADKALESLKLAMRTHLKEARIIMTSRWRQANIRNDSFFRINTWRRAQVDEFDLVQQYMYLRQMARPIPRAQGLDQFNLQRAIETVAPSYRDTADLLAMPVVLSLIARLGGNAVKFRTRGELYFAVDNHLSRDAEAKFRLKPDTNRRLRWQEILAATAFEMTIGGYGDVVQGDHSIQSIRDAVSRRIGEVSTEEWSQIEDYSRLTHHAMLDNMSEEAAAWSHRGMREFYCGIFLAKNKQDGWRNDEFDDRNRLCSEGGLVELASSDDGYWPFRFAIEMDRAVWQAKPETLESSLSVLFVKPPPDHGRPSELIYRAAELFENIGRAFSSWRGIRDRFQRQFRSLVDNGDTTAFQFEDRFVACPPFANPTADDLTFWMGEGEQRREVTLENGPFQMAVMQTTNAEFELFDPAHIRHESSTGDCHPVNRVSWYDAWAFCLWLGPDASGNDYRLPTEAEWEFACRAGSNGAYCRILASDGSIRDLSDTEEDLRSVAHFADFESTQPVGKLLPNAWGIFDMLGNLWEWCDDWRDKPAGFRSLRGGSFGDNARVVRSAYRLGYRPAITYLDVGFRVARALPRKP